MLYTQYIYAHTVHTTLYIQYTYSIHRLYMLHIQHTYCTYTVHTTVYTEYIHINQVDKNKIKICKYENKHILFRRWA